MPGTRDKDQIYFFFLCHSSLEGFLCKERRWLMNKIITTQSRFWEGLHYETLRRERLISFWRTYQRKEPKAKEEKAAPPVGGGGSLRRPSGGSSRERQGDFWQKGVNFPTLHAWVPKDTSCRVACWLLPAVQRSWYCYSLLQVRKWVLREVDDQTYMPWSGQA